MKKLNLFFLILLLSVSLIGCQNNNLNLIEDISSIKIYEWDSNTLITTIEDNEFIDELEKELNSASTDSTANMDYPSPDYELIFKNSENENMFRIGYYAKVVNLGVKGRYLDVNEDVMYEVELQLPLILSGS